MDANANLGLATTREILSELEARGELEYLAAPSLGAGVLNVSAKFLLDILHDDILDYRTVDE
jgi:O-acetyl-ADP-ribose deacetylase (regulator of RNase III)